MEIQSQAVAKMLKTSLLKPYEKNQKIHTEDQIKAIMKSIKAYGMLQPIVVDNQMVIVVGHARFEACQRLELKEVPCILTGGLSDHQIKQYRIADNKLNELSYFDNALLKEEIDEILNTPDFDISTLGFSNDELNTILSTASVDDYLLDETAEDEANDLNNIVNEEPSPEPPSNPKKTDDDYASFELIMRVENKDLVYDAIQTVMTQEGIPNREEALTFIAKAYLDGLPTK